MAADEFRQVGAADLFFSFDDELDVGGEGIGLHHGLQGLDVHVKLPFVIGGTPREDLAVLYDRIEGAAVPELQRIRRLYIIMPVDEDGGFGWVGDLFGVDDGMPFGGVDLGLAGAGVEEPLSYGFRTFFQVFLMLAAGADRWDAEEFQQFAEKTVFIFILVVFPSLHSHDFYRSTDDICEPRRGGLGGKYKGIFVGPAAPMGGKYRPFGKIGMDGGGFWQRMGLKLRDICKIYQMKQHSANLLFYKPIRQHGFLPGLLLLLACFGCKKDSKPPVPAQPRNVRYILYVKNPFPDDDKLITFDVIMKNGDRVLFDSAFAPMKISAMPDKEHAIVVNKPVPTGNENADLVVGFLYTIENVGFSWHLDTARAGNPLKIAEYPFE